MSRSRLVSTAALLGVGLSAAGCYQRTIHAEGPSAGRMTVEEPYAERTVIDDILYGPEDRERDKVAERKRKAEERERKKRERRGG